MAGWHHGLRGHGLEHARGDGQGQEAWCAAVRAVAESDTAERTRTTSTLSARQRRSSARPALSALRDRTCGRLSPVCVTDAAVRSRAGVTAEQRRGAWQSGPSSGLVFSLLFPDCRDSYKRRTLPRRILFKKPLTWGELIPAQGPSVYRRPWGHRPDLWELPAGWSGRYTP